MWEECQGDETGRIGSELSISTGDLLNRSRVH